MTEDSKHRMVFENGARWASNILTELLSNYAREMTAQERETLARACSALGDFSRKISTPSPAEKELAGEQAEHREALAWLKTAERERDEAISEREDARADLRVALAGAQSLRDQLTAVERECDDAREALGVVRSWERFTKLNPDLDAQRQDAELGALVRTCMELSPELETLHLAAFKTRKTITFGAWLDFGSPQGVPKRKTLPQALTSLIAELKAEQGPPKP